VKQTHVSRGAWWWKLSIEPIGIEPQWGPPDLDQIPENPTQFVGILDYRDDVRLGAALRTDKRIDHVDLCEKPGLGAFAGIDVDFLVVIRQWFIAKGLRSAIRGLSSQRYFVQEASRPYRRISCIRYGGMCYVSFARKSRVSKIGRFCLKYSEYVV
jgi:hypothetical protein